jgi:hypothetical protein
MKKHNTHNKILYFSDRHPKVLRIHTFSQKQIFSDKADSLLGFKSIISKHFVMFVNFGYCASFNVITLMIDNFTIT